MEAKDAKEFAEKMREAIIDDDPEETHIKMDDLMCEKLRELGYGKAVDVFESTNKWYA